MRIIRHIAFFFCLTLVFSCTKPEDDSPSNIVPSFFTDESFRDFDRINEDVLRLEDENPTPVFINDDGDDESGPSGTGNSK
jgi:hypothetical protein